MPPGEGLLQRWAAIDGAGVEHVVEILYQTAAPGQPADNNQTWLRYTARRGGGVIEHQVIDSDNGRRKLEVSSTVVVEHDKIRLNLVAHDPDANSPTHAAGQLYNDDPYYVGHWTPYSSSGGSTTFTLPTPTQQTFTDVPTSSVFYEDIEIATALGIISGYNGPSAGTREFKPGNNVNRAQAAKMVVEGIKAVLRLMSGGAQAASKKGK